METMQNKKVIGLPKDELEEKIMTALTAKTYSYIMDDGDIHVTKKRQKEQKNV